MRSDAKKSPPVLAAEAAERRAYQVYDAMCARLLDRAKFHRLAAEDSKSRGLPSDAAFHSAVAVELQGLATREGWAVYICATMKPEDAAEVFRFGHVRSPEERSAYEKRMAEIRERVAAELDGPRGEGSPTR